MSILEPIVKIEIKDSEDPLSTNNEKKDDDKPAAKKRIENIEVNNGSNRRVSYDQLETLYGILIKNKTLATSHNKSARARHLSHKMWLRASPVLNSHEMGAYKDGRGWCKYWTDYKSKLRKRAANAKSATSHSDDGTPDAPPFSKLENKFLELLEDSPTTDPHCELSEQEAVESQDPSSSSPQTRQSIPQYSHNHFHQSNCQSLPNPTITLVPQCQSDSASRFDILPSSCNMSNESPNTLTLPTNRLTKLRNGRLKRHNTLVCMKKKMQFEKRTMLFEKTNLRIMRNILAEVQEIKELIKERLPVPSKTTE